MPDAKSMAFAFAIFTLAALMAGPATALPLVEKLRAYEDFEFEPSELQGCSSSDTAAWRMEVPVAWQPSNDDAAVPEVQQKSAAFQEVPGTSRQVWKAWRDYVQAAREAGRAVVRATRTVNITKAEYTYVPEDVGQDIDQYAKRNGSFLVVHHGQLTAVRSAHFPAAGGVYVIVIAEPSFDPLVEKKGMPTPRWTAVYVGLGSSLRERMKKYIHPRTGPGTFHPEANELHKYHMFRAIQSRGFSIEVRWWITAAWAGEEMDTLHGYDFPLNKRDKVVSQYRDPEIPSLESTMAPNSQTRVLAFHTKGLEQYPVVYPLPCKTGVGTSKYADRLSVPAATTTCATTHSAPRCSKKLSPEKVMANDMDELKYVFSVSTSVINHIKVAYRAKVLAMLHALGDPTKYDELASVMSTSAYVKRHLRNLALQVIAVVEEGIAKAKPNAEL